MSNQNNKTIDSDEDEEDIISACNQPPSSVSNRTTSELESERVTFAAAQAAFEERVRKKLTMPSKKLQKSSNTLASPPQNTTKETPPDNITTSKTSVHGLELNAKSIVHQSDDADDIGPEPPVAMLEASAADIDIAKKTLAAIPNNLESINEMSPPTPFNYAQFQAATANIPDNKTDLINQLSPPTPFHPHNVPDTKILADREVSVNQLSPPVPFNPYDITNDDDDAITKKKAKDMMKEVNQKPEAIVGTTSDSISMHNPPTTYENEEDHPVFQRQQQQVIRRSPPPSMLINPRGSTDQPRTSENSTTNTSVHEASSMYELPSDNPTTTQDDGDVLTLEATLVPDIPIYDATPVLEEEGHNDKDDEEVLPWYKRHKRYLIMGVVVLVVIVMISVMATLFVDLYKDKNKSETAVSNEDKDNDQSSTPPPTSTSIQDASSTNSTAVTISVTPSPAVSDMPIQSPTLTSSSHPSVSLLPTTTFKCFGADDRGCDSVDDILGGCTQFGTLGSAVRAYVSQGCANNQQCDIAQVYGWPMNSWCIGNVRDMSYLFYKMDTFNEDISGWITSSVTDMSYMFWRATSFNGDLSNFDTSSVTNMADMFSGASSFNRDLSNFDTSSVTNMGSMFQGADAFNQNVSMWDLSSVTSVFFMFFGATSFSQDLCAWRDSFPYTSIFSNIFAFSGCTYQGMPQEAQKGPFCASNCQSSSVVSYSISSSS